MSARQPISAELVRNFVLASHANIEQVKAFYENESGLVRASLDWGEGDWECSLEAAGHMGNTDIAQFLLSKGAPQTVFCAAMLGNVELVRAFVDSDPKVIHQPGVHRISLIYHAALSGKVEIADLLEQCGSPSGKDQALHAAIRFEHVEMVEWLLTHGVTDVNMLNFQKQTPLSAAVEKGYSKIAGMLRDSGGHE